MSDDLDDLDDIPEVPDYTDETDEADIDDDSELTEEDIFDEEDPTAAEEAGEQAAKPFLATLSFIRGAVASFLMAFIKRIPLLRGKVLRGMINNGVEGLWKTSGAAAIVLCIYGDGVVVPRPAEWDKEQRKLRTDNGEEWSVPNGLDLNRIGDAPIAWGVVDSHEIIQPVQARIAEKVECGPSEWETVEVDEMAGTAQPARSAMADGGQTSWAGTAFDDIWVDGRNPDKDATGMIVSMKTAYDLHWSQAGTEELQNQEMRGRLAEKDPASDTRKALIMVALALGGIALGMFGPALASNIAGSGSSAAGDAVPMMLGWF